VTRQGPPAPAAGPAVEGYLAEVAGRLPGPDRAHGGIVAELRSGLLDAMDAYQSAGLPADQAVQAAIREFGDPGRVAAGFRAEIAAAQARRAVVTLLVTGPLVGLLWIATASHLGIRFAVPWQRAGLGASLGAGLLLVAVAVGVTALAGVVGIASTGRLTRWLTAPPRLAPTAAVVAGFGAVSADSLGLVLLAVQLAAAPGKLSPVPAIAAAAASVARLLLARRAARQCLALRASLA
jgi:hypothetical protein